MAERGVAARVRHLLTVNPFLTATAVAAALTCLLVPPSAEYLHYPEYRTLVGLWCFLTVISALDRTHLVTAAAEGVVGVLRGRRTLVVGLVLLTALGSMLITNDMALLTFLPLSALALRATGDEQHLAYVFVLQTVAANLGGMITPFGSPQNLFLYQYFHLSVGQLVAVMAIPFALSIALLVLACLRVPGGAIRPVTSRTPVRWRPAAVHLVLFAVAVALVVRALPVWAGLVVVAVVAVVDLQALRSVDYGLLATFVLFFVFAGNLERVPQASGVLQDLLQEHVLLWSVAGSQLISNVPTALIYAPFTDDWRALLLGVNVGGVGTVVASLASLITLRRYQLLRPGGTRAFLGLFTVVNVLFLVVLLGATSALLAAGVL
ncbi:SLC13 family permease [Aeromicrobium sp. CnD17-E]|uniref:SLC13 family permease n=1 Tax=Aeromicrobium sp. CnD17-E TaxID=2954487 RepID=UPI002097FC29|nr:SLC13 family permease [Aeromicrobium sp. CnD17-E]MCO7238083.1 SLC13 family permease [Aeromicrobium sp. CnD17-E]